MEAKEVEKLRNRVQHRLNRCKARAAYYEGREDSLSVHGGWSKGYFEGQVAILEDMLDDLTDLLGESVEDVSKESKPVEPSSKNVPLKVLNKEQSKRFRQAFESSGLELGAIQRAKEIAKRGFHKN